jgi:hypothetical protein
VWLANSNEADARAMRDAQQHVSLPWRVLYRVTYCERFLPPVSNDAIVVPQITPVMAIPVLNPASDFIFKSMTALGPRPAHNPLNDVEANLRRQKLDFRLHARSEIVCQCQTSAGLRP